jgi:hypothetical protein
VWSARGGPKGGPLRGFPRGSQKRVSTRGFLQVASTSGEQIRGTQVRSPRGSPSWVTICGPHGRFPKVYTKGGLTCLQLGVFQRGSTNGGQPRGPINGVPQWENTKCAHKGGIKGDPQGWSTRGAPKEVPRKGGPTSGVPKG